MRWQLFLVTAFAVLGCHPAPPPDPITGTWKGQTDANGVHEEMTTTYGADGRFAAELVAAKTGAVSRITVKETGTWKRLSPDHYWSQAIDIDANVTGATPASTKKIIKDFASQKAKLMAEDKKHPNFTTRWIGADHMVTTNEAHHTQTYKRAN